MTAVPPDRDSDDPTPATTTAQASSSTTTDSPLAPPTQTPHLTAGAPAAAPLAPHKGQTAPAPAAPADTPDSNGPARSAAANTADPTPADEFTRKARELVSEVVIRGNITSETAAQLAKLGIDAVPSILESLPMVANHTRRDLIRVLAEHPDRRSLPTLLNYVESRATAPNDDIIPIALRAAALTLGPKDADRVFPFLTTLANHHDPLARAALSRALAALQSPDAIHCTLAMVGDPHPFVAENAMGAIHTTPTALARQLAGMLRKGASLASLAAQFTPATPQVNNPDSETNAVPDSDTTTSPRAGSDALVDPNQSLSQALIATLRDALPHSRGIARTRLLEFAAQLPAPNLADALLEITRGPSSEHAVLALDALQSQPAAPPLQPQYVTEVRKLAHIHDPFVAAAAATALARAAPSQSYIAAFITKAQPLTLDRLLPQLVSNLHRSPPRQLATQTNSALQNLARQAAAGDVVLSNTAAVALETLIEQILHPHSPQSRVGSDPERSAPPLAHATQPQAGPRSGTTPNTRPTTDRDQHLEVPDLLSTHPDVVVRAVSRLAAASPAHIDYNLTALLAALLDGRHDVLVLGCGVLARATRVEATRALQALTRHPAKRVCDAAQRALSSRTSQ